MDPSRFDTLVRTLTTGPSRRRLLGVLSALPLVGAALAAVPDDTTVAKGKRKSRGSGHSTVQDPEQDRQRTGSEATSCARRCRKKSSKQARRKCRKRCTPPTPECTTSQDCPTGELCESGVCIPIPDQCTGDTDCDECEREYRRRSDPPAFHLRSSRSCPLPAPCPKQTQLHHIHIALHT